MGCVSSREGGGDDIALQEREAELERLRERIRGLEEASRTVSSGGAASGGSAESAELRARVQQLENEVREAKTEAQQLREEKKAQPTVAVANNNNNNNNTNNAAAKAAVEESDRLRAQLQQLQNELQQQKSLADQKTGELQRLQGELAEQKKKSAAALNESKKKIVEQTVVVAANASDGDDVQALKAKLAEERDLTAKLRKELNDRSKETFIKASEAKNTSGASVVVLSEATERMKQNELDLKSQISLLRQEVQEARDRLRQRDQECDKLRDELSRLKASAANKDKTIADLTVKYSDSMTHLPQVESKSNLDSALELLDAKHSKLDADMEMMEENMRLQALLQEKEEIIEKLKAERK